MSEPVVQQATGHNTNSFGLNISFHYKKEVEALKLCGQNTEPTKAEREREREKWSCEHTVQ